MADTDSDDENAVTTQAAAPSPSDISKADLSARLKSLYSPANNAPRPSLQPTVGTPSIGGSTINTSATVSTTHNNGTTNLQPSPRNIVAAPMPSRQQLPTAVIINSTPPTSSNRPLTVPPTSRPPDPFEPTPLKTLIQREPPPDASAISAPQSMNNSQHHMSSQVQQQQKALYQQPQNHQQQRTMIPPQQQQQYAPPPQQQQQPRTMPPQQQQQFTAPQLHQQQRLPPMMPNLVQQQQTQQQAQLPPPLQANRPSSTSSNSTSSTARASNVTNVPQNSTAAAAAHARAKLEREAKQRKEKFLMFTRVLMKYLEQKDPAMHVRAKSVIRECAEKNKANESGYESITATMQSKLRATVGEPYWERAESYLNHFLKQKELELAKRKKAGGPSVRAVAPGQPAPQPGPPQMSQLQQPQHGPSLIVQQQQQQQLRQQQQQMAPRQMQQPPQQPLQPSEPQHQLHQAISLSSSSHEANRLQMEEEKNYEAAKAAQKKRDEQKRAILKQQQQVAQKQQQQQVAQKQKQQQQQQQAVQKLAVIQRENAAQIQALKHLNPAVASKQKVTVAMSASKLDPAKKQLSPSLSRRASGTAARMSPLTTDDQLPPKEFAEYMETLDHMVDYNWTTAGLLLSSKADVNLQEEQRKLVYGESTVVPKPTYAPASRGWSQRNVVSARVAWARIRAPEQKEERQAIATGDMPVVQGISLPGPSNSEQIQEQPKTQWFNEDTAESDMVCAMLSEATEIYLKSILEKALACAQQRQNIQGVRLWHLQHGATTPPFSLRLGCDVPRQVAQSIGNAAKAVQRMEEAIDRSSVCEKEIDWLHASSMADMALKAPLSSAAEQADYQAKRAFEVYGGKDSGGPPFRVAKKAKLTMNDFKLGLQMSPFAHQQFGIAARDFV